MTLAHDLGNVRFPAGDRPAAGEAPVRASWAGRCARELWYQRHWPRPWQPTLEEQLRLEMGQRAHELVQAVLLRLWPEGTVEAEGLWWDGPGAFAPRLFLGAHADFLYGDEGETVAVEIKTVQAPWAVTRGPADHHWLQAELVALACGAHRIVVLLVARSNGETASVERAASSDIATAEYYRLLAALTSEDFPPRIDERMAHWRCRGCPYATECTFSTTPTTKMHLHHTRDNEDAPPF